MIVQHPHAVLSLVAPEAVLASELATIQREAWKAVGLCRTARGVGLAWPQMGLSRRAFVFGGVCGGERIFVNPTYSVCHQHGETPQVDIEGCLSVHNGGRYARVTRPYRIIARFTEIEKWWSDAKAHPVEKTTTFFGFDARVFLHETDHLNGILLGGEDLT